MNQQKKLVLIIEDDKAQLEVFIKTLKQYGFEAEGGQTIAHTFELLQKYGNDAAVILLDMDLTRFADYKEQTEKIGSAITGTDLAKLLLKENPAQRPQLIILSAYIERIEYFRNAIKAGASDYLQKGAKEDREKFMPSIQALALKYSFQPNSSNDKEIADLVKGHANRFEVLNYFCANKLARELDLCLTEASYILLFRNKNNAGEQLPEPGKFVSMRSDMIDIPDRENFDYSQLHEQIFSQISRYSVYIPEDNDFPEKNLGGLKDCMFVQLVNSSEVEIAIGILSPFPIEDKLKKYSILTEVLAEALIEHASPFLETFVEKIMFHWRERQGLKLEKVKTLEDLSNSIQRELNTRLPDKSLKTIEQSFEYFDSLKRFSEELANYGRHLFSLLETNRHSILKPNISTIRLSEVIQKIKIEYDRKGYFNDVLFSVENDCLISVEPDYFSMALHELIKWAVERKANVAYGEKQLIQIDCKTRDNWVEIYFRENSKQLSKAVRENYLFEPIKPLHIAQMIIEVALYGELIDITDESKKETGHTFKIKLLNS